MKDVKEIKRSGWLKYGNPTGDFSKAPRCGAKTRQGKHCMAPAMKNGRCRMHGGKSTGPKTMEGVERIRQSRLKHGLYSQRTKSERKMLRVLLKKYTQTIATMDDRLE